jgi:hypothetical protein
MQLLIPLLILAGNPSASIDLTNQEAFDVYRCDFTRQTVAGAPADADINYDGWPDEWKRRRGPGFPKYIKIGIVSEDDSSAPAPGPTDASAPDEAARQRWLRVDLDGGAATAFAPPQEVSPGFAYVLEGRLRTEGLERNLAYYSITLFDAAEQVVEYYESPRIRSPGAWKTVSIGPLSPKSGEVRKAVIGLHVAPSGESDLRGSVCFDDLRLARLPRMSLIANRVHHVYDDPNEIVLTYDASGVREPNPQLTFRVFDVLGELVDEEVQQLAVEPSAHPSDRAAMQSVTYAGSTRWKPRIAAPGFYRVDAEMGMQQGPAQHRTLSLVVIDPEMLPTGGFKTPGQFGWTLPHDREPLPLETLASLVSLAGVQWVKLPAWFNANDQQLGDRLARFVERVEQDGVTVVGVLDRPPAESQWVFSDEEQIPVASMFIEKDAWQGAVDPVMTRLTPIIRWWQLGDDYDASFVGFPGLEAKIQEIQNRLGRFGQSILLGFAWRWSQDSAPRAAKSPPWQFLAYNLDPADSQFTAAELSAHLARLQGAERSWVGLQPLPQGEYDLTTRARDLVERMLASKIAGAHVAFVTRPFDPSSGLMNADGTPTELFPVWRTTASLLAGTEYLGAIETPLGSKNHVFARGEQSVMIVWNDRAVEETLYLGEDVRQIDLWSRQVRPQRQNEQHTVKVGPLPTFVTGLNTAIARWRMSFQFEDASLSSILGRQQRLKYRYTNPFRQGVTGRIVFHTPDVWDTERDRPPVKLGASEAHSDALQVTLRPMAGSGKQQIRADFEITADREYRFSVWRTVDVGLGELSMELSTRLDDEGRLVVEQQFINRSSESVNFLCQLFAPGRPRVRRAVLDLNQGRTTIFYYLPQGEALLGQTLILRAEEINGHRALNHRFEAK